MSDKVVELGRHDPTVESVITRLYQHMGRINHITAIIEWDNGASDVFYDTKELELLCLDSAILTKLIQSEIINRGDE